MDVNKLILQTVLWTFAAIVALLAFMIFALSLIFPATMMGLTYDLGMEKTSIYFAEKVYYDTDNVLYIAHATEVAIEVDEQDKIISCGEIFLADDGFDGYCQEKENGAEYEQFIYGQICVAKYDTGDADGAIALAEEGLKGGFPKNNAMVALVVIAKANNDEVMLNKIKGKLESFAFEGEEKMTLENTLSLLESRE